MAFLVLGLLGGLLVDRQPGLGRFLLILLAAYLLIYCLINGVRVFLQKKKVSTARNRFITMTVSILLSLVLCVVLNWLLFHMERPASKATEMAVTIQDLTGETDDDLIEQSSIHTSLLMSCRDFTQHSPYEQPSENRVTLHYTQSDIHFSPLYDAVLDRVFHKYDRFYTEDETSHTRLYRETDPTPWGAQAVYQYEYDGTPDSSYILCWPGRIVEFHASWFLTEEQMSIVGSCFSQ